MKKIEFQAAARRQEYTSLDSDDFEDGEDFLEELNDEIDDLKTDTKGEASRNSKAGSLKNVFERVGNINNLIS